MSTVAWKFPLGPSTGPVERQIPVGATLLHVGEDPAGPPGTIAVWAKVDDQAPRELRAFFLSFTGERIPPGMDHVGTVIIGSIVVHVWVLPGTSRFPTVEI